MSSRKLRFDGWVLDPESGELERAGARIRLQDQPARVLQELIAHAGSVVTRGQLIALLWPKGVVDFDTSLNTVIRKLRGALADLAETPRYIETLPRRGYRFIGALDRDFGALSSNPPAHVASVVQRAQVTVCVLPFENMSGDPEQEYFSDGITEDIITDLSKVSALSVISRNSAFEFKGRHVDVPKIARDLAVTYVLEGSVRKAGGRVRISAQLVDGSTNGHVWADRYDRDLEDIFAVQDEIAHAIVKALQLQLLPVEKHAIEKRGTESVEAYNLYLMARQHYVSGTEGDLRRAEAIIRLCARATEIDPLYARAWALLSLGHVLQQYVHGGDPEAGMAAAEQALALDPNLAEAHAMKARIHSDNGRSDAASVEIAKALLLDPASYEVHRSAGYLRFRQNRQREAASHFERAMAIGEADVNSAQMLVSCYQALGDARGVLRAAQLILRHTERMVAQDSNNAAALSYGATALAVVGNSARARDWMNRALLLEPDNIKMRYNLACSAAAILKQPEVALELLSPVFDKIAVGMLNHAKADPDLDSLREHPRFKEMVSAAETRHYASEAVSATAAKADG
jgi:adenylate cyclase